MNDAAAKVEPERMFRAAAVRADIPSFIVMDVMRAAAAKEASGAKVIHMEVGQPATSAPKAARTAVSAALDRDTLGYTLALGLPQLRQRIAALYKAWYGIDISPERIVVTNGSSAAFVLTFLALFDVGQKVALPNPGYPCYRHILTALGVEPMLLETGPETRWMPTVGGLQAAVETAGLAGLLIASPANPTGTMIEPDRLAELVDVCRRNKLWFVSDEIYHGLTYALPARTALQFSDNVVVINSFSKFFSMTGWRVGWMVVPEGLVRTVERLAQISIFRRLPSPRWRLSGHSTDRTNSKPTFVSTGQTAIFFSKHYPMQVSAKSCPRTAHFICMSTSANTRRTASRSVAKCLMKRGLPRRPALISIPAAAIASCVFPMQGRRPIWRKRRTT